MLNLSCCKLKRFLYRGVKSETINQYNMEEWLRDLLRLGKMYYTCRNLNKKIYVPVKLLHKVSTGAGTSRTSEMHNSRRIIPLVVC